MKKKEKINKFDHLVDNLIVEFSKIPNFDLTQTDELANCVFSTISFRMAEIISYKELVCQSFIPATNKAIFDAKKNFNNSRYKSLLNNKEPDFKETLYDTIRLSYVGLFHKLENYINDVIKLYDLVFSNAFKTDANIHKWAKDNFQFDIKNWRQFFISEKINWICNCVKHHDGFPVKEPKPVGFRYSNENERIKISPEIFKADCDFLIQFYPVYLQLFSFFAQHKKLHEQEESEYTPEMYVKIVEAREKMDKLVRDCLKSITN